MKAIKNNILVGGVVSILLIALLFQPIKKSLRGYSVITVYSLGQMHDGTWTLPLNRTRYRIYENQNKVMYWYPGVIESPTLLNNCIVRDKCNWTCPYSDDSGSLRIENCRGIDDLSGVLPVKYTSALNWWKLSF